MIVTFVIYWLVAAKNMPSSLGSKEKSIFKPACLKVSQLNTVLAILALISMSPCHCTSKSH